MSHYEHLTPEEREKILLLHSQNYSITYIAAAIDRNKSTVSCELALNGVQFYFPKPHQPWKRGTNENTNGLLREYFPKGEDISSRSDEYIQSKVDELNKSPRK